ncbi:MAG: hypothetical protein PHV34_05705 [Verrucomicrobiae bacterium]|nr:hypothetical protein [Verrucomicrobiae bacterium]
MRIDCFVSMLAAWVVLCRFPAMALDYPSDWKNIQQFKVAKAGLVKFSLPVDTLDASRPLLEDLRLHDSAGRETPFLIERSLRKAQASVAVKQFQVFMRNETTVIEMTTGLSRPIDQVVLETPALEFMKSAKVEVSADRKNWRLAAEGVPLFRQTHGARQLALALSPEVCPCLRITIDDHRREAVPWTGARVRIAPENQAPREDFKVLIRDRIESPGETRLLMEMPGAHLTLAGMEIETTSPLFARVACLISRQYAENEFRETVLARGTIQRISGTVQPLAGCPLFDEDVMIPSRCVELAIRNEDSPPLEISGVKAWRRPVWVVFMAPGPGDYTLLSGNSRCAAPRYDMPALADKLRGLTPSPVAAGALTVNPAFREPEFLPEVAETGAALDISRWRWRKPVQLTRGGVQQLELDLEVLARAKAGLGDLRLIRDGRQIPYVVERTGLTRDFAPQTAPMDDPKHPRNSCWRITLPLPSAPVTGLSCKTRKPGVFQRRVSVWEERRDERGIGRRVDLGSGTWSRRPGEGNGMLWLPFATPPVGDILVLVVENGDNPALELDDFRLWHPVMRLVFKAGEGLPLFLHYGSREASTPQYDIALAAPFLLTAEKNKCFLGKEESTGKRGKDPVSPANETSSGASWWFWAVLAAVVAALLAAIARLAPKNPA